MWELADAAGNSLRDSEQAQLPQAFASEQTLAQHH